MFCWRSRSLIPPKSAFRPLRLVVVEAKITCSCDVLESALMRRCLSSLLLVLTCAGVLLPLLQGSSTDVPACCRRDGKHHCMRPTGADGFKSAVAACPYRCLRVLTTRATALVAGRKGVRRSALPGTIQTLELSHLAFRVSESCQERAPPAS